MSAEDTIIRDETPTPAPAAQAEAPAPAEQPTQEVKAEGEKPEGADEAQDGRDRDDKGRFKPVQGRIDELTRARREAEREAAYWRQMAQGQAEQPKAAAKPTVDQFENFGEYVEALTDWKAKAAASELLQQRAQVQQQEVVKTTWAERQAEARQRLPDFDDVMQAADAPVAKHVAEALMESPKGPDLAYHFARNPADLARINSLPPLQAALEVGRLEATLARSVAPATRTTQAPKPASVGASNGRAVSLDPARMSMDEYRKYRASQGARWAK